MVDVIIHRAHNALAPENSLSGIEEIRALSSDFAIEIDVCVTRDGVLVVHHDLSLERMCGVPRLVSELDCAELPYRNDGLPILRLDDVLTRYPEQKFMLDFRTDLHPDMFPGSSLAENARGAEPLDMILSAAQRGLGRDVAERTRVVVGSEDHRRIAATALPGFSIDIAEHYFRDAYDGMVASDDPQERCGAERVYIRFRFVTREIVRWCHAHGFEIYANHQVAIRSVDASLAILERCIDWGIDGMIASPIDRRFLARLQASRDA